MDFLKINGGYGEGGGQIIRSAITLSCITKQPIHLENIRKNRKDKGKTTTSYCDSNFTKNFKSRCNWS